MRPRRWRDWRRVWREFYLTDSRLRPDIGGGGVGSPGPEARSCSIRINLGAHGSLGSVSNSGKKEVAEWTAGFDGGETHTRCKTLVRLLVINHQHGFYFILN